MGYLLMLSPVFLLSNKETLSYIIFCMLLRKRFDNHEKLFYIWNQVIAFLSILGFSLLQLVLLDCLNRICLRLLKPIAGSLKLFIREGWIHLSVETLLCLSMAWLELWRPCFRHRFHLIMYRNRYNPTL